MIPLRSGHVVTWQATATFRDMFIQKWSDESAGQTH
jgi:hypothetical protein